MCFLSNNIYDYYNVSQGKITVPGIDDGEEMQAADVSSYKICLYSSLNVFKITCLNHQNFKLISFNFHKIQICL
jgi:hypothetical protein